MYYAAVRDGVVDYCRTSYLARRPLLIVLFVYSIFLLILTRTPWWHRVSDQNAAAWTGQSVLLTGVVSVAPDRQPHATILLVEAETIRLSSHTHSVCGQVRIQVSKAPSGLAQPGDRVQARGRLVSPAEARVPGTFDFRSYLAHRGVHSVLHTGTRGFWNTGPSGRYRLARWGWKLNERVVGIFSRHLSEDEAAVLAGLVAGRRPRFHPEVKRAFTESGTMHVLVASGSNVAFVIGFWFLAGRILTRASRRVLLISSLPAAWTYALLAGMDPPVSRAALMASLTIAAYALSREDNPIHVLGVAGLILLLINPRLIMDLGFQMSFVTVFGLLVTWNSIETLPGVTRPWFGWPMRLASATLIAQLWLLPLTLSVFKRLYPISVVSNLLIVPMAAAGLLVGVVLIAINSLVQLMPFLHHLLEAWAGLTAIYIRALYGSARFFADHPGWVIWSKGFGAATTVGFYALCVAAPRFKTSTLAKFMTGMGLLLFIIGCIPRRERVVPNVAWFDVGRSLATLIEAPEKTRVLLFNSPTPAIETWERTILPYLTERGLHKLTAVATTEEISIDDKKRIERWIHIKRWIGPSLRDEHHRLDGIHLDRFTPRDSYTKDPPAVVRFSSHTLLLMKGLGLRTQGVLVEQGLKNVAVVQGSFSPRVRWSRDFIERIRPTMIIENGFDSETRPSTPPWEGVEIGVPQKSGVVIWTAGDAGKN